MTDIYLHFLCAHYRCTRTWLRLGGEPPLLLERVRGNLQAQAENVSHSSSQDPRPACVDKAERRIIPNNTRSLETLSRVRGNIIGHARIKYVGKYQSCMV